jgi:glycerophosphoryl diester phosphodiesterase
MILIGHRGFRIGVVENTFQAFRKAIRLNLDYIELDVHLSKDEVLYVHHDASLSRIMNTSGIIEEKVSEELDKIKSPVYGLKLPRLKEVIEKILIHPPKIHKTGLMIELKGSNTARFVCGLINRYKIHKQVIFSGRNLQELIQAHNIIPEIPICLNITKCKEFTIKDLFNCSNKLKLPLPFAMISLKSTKIKNQKFINFSQKSFERMKKMITFGIDGMLLDDPDSIKPLEKEIR